ncbi:hypothetical protein DAETH_35900 (plasmid) [Deinococcus aetherius]|uniref:Uncharacterized protein n=1 Tax=Deinococcus aetherius TaxID=200252 RepID=A0ABN6RJX2_9DEIO|nr:hypothetical protein [Deinococcus aetherius]BDP43621.1 hypothetical protein DAETH_35900 [Deinococcus aetherius]
MTSAPDPPQELARGAVDAFVLLLIALAALWWAARLRGQGRNAEEVVASRPRPRRGSPTLTFP